jgi:hypothetical protein
MLSCRSDITFAWSFYRLSICTISEVALTVIQLLRAHRRVSEYALAALYTPAHVSLSPELRTLAFRP